MANIMAVRSKRLWNKGDARGFNRYVSEPHACKRKLSNVATA